MSRNQSKKKGTPSGTDIRVLKKGMSMDIVVPVSERAKKLFMYWGMEDGYDGVYAPDNPMDLVNSFPRNWVLDVMELEDREYKVVEVPLPQPLMVLH